jgi:mRNA-degrading endonuclease RelE of RelBE toxin-antitoxin system
VAPIEVTKAFERDWRKVKDPTLRTRFTDAINKIEPIGADSGDITRLEGAAAGWYRLRVGDWRLVFWVTKKDDQDHIALARIIPRGELDQVARRLKTIDPETERSWP